MNHEVPEGIRLAMELKALTYSGWLRYVKGLSYKECIALLTDSERSRKYSAEYEEWIKGRLA